MNRIFTTSSEDEYSKEEIEGYKILEMIGKVNLILYIK